MCKHQQKLWKNSWKCLCVLPVYEYRRVFEDDDDDDPNSWLMVFVLKNKHSQADFCVLFIYSII